jgi:CO/xanthine dehydrogenase Mo-binding subunit
MVVGGSLYATFVQATVANAALKSIDPSKALAMKGVITFISAASLKADKYCNLVRYNTTSQTIISKDYTQHLSYIRFDSVLHSFGVLQ